ncbi:MAG: methionine--tRNA ligase [Spirochaetaceae bacterium]|nr:MAG: methionine--tRNA ligase [Spirochaetaceae bacterium]
MKRRLITSALPYVNNIPHLGNLIQVLSADVFARFCRLRGYETLYICGTDEYGTATETRAREEGITPKELCDRYYAIHDEIYRWFQISFDNFGRTSTEKHTEITQHIFRKLYDNGYIVEREIEQLYSEASDMFLADRYVRGTCPHCGYENARGDQCENCGKLLDPSDLIDPRSALDNTTPIVKKTRHLYINLPAVLPKLEAWLAEASKGGKWARNAIQMTQAWIRDGLKERAITRDLKWGIPVPLEGFRDKVFYVWFDAPIGYISITANLTDDWESWWRKPEEVELFQFIGKDNIPFHTVIFPSSLIGTGERWTLLHHMSSSEYLNYEGGQFSKSRGVGVFGNDAQDTGIAADVWRFYMFYNRPETSDFTFTWDDFREKVNGELIGNLGNLVNRTLTFQTKYFGATLPEEDSAGTVSTPQWKEFWSYARKLQGEITDHLENAQLREAFRKTFALSSYGNKVFQEAEPWKTRKSDPEATRYLLKNLVYLVRDLAILVSPYLPQTSTRIAALLGKPELSWDDLGDLSGIAKVSKPSILFATLEKETVDELRQRFSGTQAERAAKQESDAAAEDASVEERFRSAVELRAARITAVERHPKADKLYVEQVDDGSGQPRTIVSGLVGHYTQQELTGRTIVLVANLKPARLRGVESNGMLLAASAKREDGSEQVDVIFVDHANPGDRLYLHGDDVSTYARDLPQIDIDSFFAIPLSVSKRVLKVGATPVECAGKAVRAPEVSDGPVG